MANGEDLKPEKLRPPTSVITRTAEGTYPIDPGQAAADFVAEHVLGLGSYTDLRRILDRY
jgi:hypothetical protein